MTSAEPPAGDPAEEAEQPAPEQPQEAAQPAPEQEGAEPEEPEPNPIQQVTEDSTDQPDSEVREAMASFGAGNITAAQAAAAVQPAYTYALNERRARTVASDEADPDDASTPNAFSQVALAMVMGTISAQQYAELTDALVSPAAENA